MNSGCLLVISGPSGVGKSTVISHFTRIIDNCAFSVSATTRLPRPGEENGREYYFVSKEEFSSMVSSGKMLEHAEYSGNYYGTPKDPVITQLREEKTVILDIEVQGAFQVKKALPEAISVFILPPSMDELEHRLRGRGTESEEAIQKRLATARKEIELAPQYDYRIVNDDAEQAAIKLANIVNNCK